MSTRGNVVFISKYWKDEYNMSEEDFKSLEMKSEIIDKSQVIYVHSDMYPTGALNMLQEFLQMTGAKSRGHDTSYLSAYFTGFKVMKMLPFTKAMSTDEEFEPDKDPCLNDMKISRDFFGVGLLNEISDDCNYTYFIVPGPSENVYLLKDVTFDIYVYENYGGWPSKTPAKIRFLGKINSEDDLTDFKDEDWWY